MIMHSLRALTATPLTRAVALLFLANGFALANWFSRIPAVKEDLLLGDGALGLALLGLPLGSALVLPFSGRLIGRAGAGRLAVMTGIATAVTAALPAFAVGIWSLGFCMFLLGMANGGMDVAMNAKAADVERASTFNTMSAFHGMYGMGFFLGSTTGSFFAWGDVGLVVHLPIAAAIGSAALLSIGPVLADKPATRPASDPVLALPHGPLWPLALIAAASFLAESAAADWSAVYLRNVVESSPAVAALALAGFSLGLTVTRFVADAVGARTGDRPLLRGGAALAGVGMTVGLLVPVAPIAILGFVTVGMGFAAVVPIAFRRAANLDGIAPGVGVAAVATVAYTGFLAGPPLIGLMAEAVGLRTAMAIIPLLAFAVFALARRSFGDKAGRRRGS
jgi:MFS family permease